ncbi:UNVERIFIED_ORG: hypothetical protein FHR35_009119 [Microbispora rosea subsp. rosea]
MGTQSWDKALEAAIGVRLASELAEEELRRLTGTLVPPPAPMSMVQARQLARHVKAALLHLRAAEVIADEAGVDLDGELPWGNGPGRLLRTASNAVEEADTWAIRNASANGCGDETWRVTRWCSQPDGALPQV